MDTKRALVTSIVGYAVIFFLASIFIGLGTQVQLVLDIMPYAMVVIVPIIVYIIGLNMYFQKTMPIDPIKDGVFLGLVWLVVSLILDIVILVYGFWGGVWTQFWTWSMMVGYAEVLLVPIIIGYMSRK